MSRSATLAQIVVDSLRQAFYDGVYAPGERLAEYGIAQEMNVSQNTARDALRILEGEGWLIRRERRGVIVRTFNGDEVEELYLLREALESLALGWLLDRSNRADSLAGLNKCLQSASTQLEVHDTRGTQNTLLDFHVALGGASGRSQTTHMLNRLHNQARLLENLRGQRAPLSSEDCAARLESYHALFNHLENREAPAAHAVLIAILKREYHDLHAIVTSES